MPRRRRLPHPPADVRDKGGPEYAYRLTASPPRPDYSLRVFPSNLRLAVGDTAIVSVQATRRDAFGDEIQLGVKNLPPGFVSRGAVIAANTSEVRFTLTAPANLPAGLLAPTIEGAAVIGGQKAVRQPLPAEQVEQAFRVQASPGLPGAAAGGVRPPDLHDVGGREGRNNPEIPIPRRPALDYHLAV